MIFIFTPLWLAAATSTSSVASATAAVTSTAASPAIAQPAIVAPAPAIADPVPPSPEDAPSVAPIRVVGSRVAPTAARAAIASTVLTRAEIEQSGARDLGGVLASQAGLDVQRSFRGTAVRLNGLDAQHVLVLVDGVPVVGRIEGATDLSRIQLDDVERVEIVQGAASALHGADALAGVIEITTRRPKKGFGAEVEVTGHSLPSVDTAARLTWAGDRARAKLRGRFTHDDPWDLDPSDLPTTGAGHTGFGVGGEGEYSLSPDQRLQAHASFLRRNARAIDGGAAGALFDRTNALENAEAGAELRSFFGAGRRIDSTLAWSLYRDQSLMDQRGADDLDTYSDTRQHQVIARVVWNERITESHRLAVGVEGTFEHLTSERLDGGEGQRFRGSAFAEHGWTVTEAPRFLVVPGVRFDADSTFGANLAPQLALRFDPIEAVILRASFGLGFRAPSFQEQLLRFQNPGAGYVVEGNPDLSPERARSWSARAEYTPLTLLKLSLSAYWNDVTDLITYIPITPAGPGQPTVYRNGNVASARTRGFDADAKLDVPLIEDALTLGLTAAYGFLDARDLDADLPLPGRSPHHLGGELHLAITAIALELSGRAWWWSKSAADDPEGRPAYTLIGARAAVDLLDRMVTLEVGIENALDEGDVDVAPLPPRTFYAGITGRI